MQFGIMMRGQFPAEDAVADRFQEMLEQARMAERLGYHSITKGAHYSTHPLQDLQQVPFLCRIAAEAPNASSRVGPRLLFQRGAFPLCARSLKNWWVMSLRRSTRLQRTPLRCFWMPRGIPLRRIYSCQKSRRRDRHSGRSRGRRRQMMPSRARWTLSRGRSTATLGSSRRGSLMLYP